MRSVADLWAGVVQSSASSLVCFLLAFVVIGAIGAGGVEALLPGGRWNPYRSSNVTKNHSVARAIAYIGAILGAFGLLILGGWLR
jgi:hypothetical protein